MSKKSTSENLPKKTFRVFAFLFDSKMLIDIIQELREKHGVEVLYWEGFKSPFESMVENETTSSTIFHNTLDAVMGVGAPRIDTSSFESASEEIIHSLLLCESRVLPMMNTIDQSNSPLIKRKQVYYSYLKYWLNVLKNLKPDAILFADVPHKAHHYVIYSLAKLLSIRVIMFRYIQITGRVILMDDIERYTNIEESLNTLKGRNFSLNDLSGDVASYLKKHMEAGQDTHPFYAKKEHMAKRARGNYPFPSIKAIIKNFKNLTFWKTAKAYTQMFFDVKRVPDIIGLSCRGYFFRLKEMEWNRIKKRFKKEHSNLQVEADFSKKFIYVPLHNQPERSTSAEGGVFADQILMVDMLSQSIPDDWRIYVKENPLQWIAPRTHAGRFDGYYQRLKRIENVDLISPEISTYKLIENSQAVASVTSTANWEAILRGKPSLLFGFIWFMYCEGVFRVDSVESCRLSIDTIKKGYKPDKQKIINFLKTVDDVSVQGYRNLRRKYWQNLLIDDKENTKNIARAFYQELTKNE